MLTSRLLISSPKKQICICQHVNRDLRSGECGKKGSAFVRQLTKYPGVRSQTPHLRVSVCTRVWPRKYLTTGPQSRSVILRLDRKIRDLEVPVGLQVLGLNSNPSGPLPPPPTTRAQVMQAHTTLCIKETCLTYLHRGYLARALSEHPDDPFKNRYAASVLAAHKSSCAVLAGVRSAFDLLPRLMPRVFFLWIHAFSAAVSAICRAK